ncbi:MAG: hypothetical protein IKL59_07905 [Clostridia bacterium]|nr:hypothetical protein [Clostridia bacterium]
MKKTFRKAAMSTICMLVVAVMSLTGVTYAWFSQSTTADVSGMTMNVAAADGGFQISNSEAGPWVSTLTWTENKESVKPVSTVNATAFFTAEVNSNNLDQIKTTADTSGANVISKTFYAQNTGDTDVTIKLANTGALANTQNSTNDAPVFIDATDGDKNSAQAGRVAIFVDNQLKYIFGDEATKGVSAASDAFFTFRGTSVDTSKTADQGTKTTPSECTFTIPGRATSADTIVEIKVVVWLEGQDTQCENENANSVFNVDLDFAVVEN